MKTWKDLVREAQLRLIEMFAFNLKSLNQALHHHHSLQLPKDYENAKA
jgi:hypothetical protein